MHAVALEFREHEQVPETKRHLKLRTLLFELLELAFADRGAIGSDQFVYWDAADPRACLAPDAFVRLGEPNELFRSWKVWEHTGPPQVAVEITSDADERDRDWGAKLARYRRLGVLELVRFDSEASSAALRIWDLVDTDLVERDLAKSGAASRVLPGFWLEVEQAGLGTTLRLAHDAAGTSLYPTQGEAAQQRVRELEAELARRNA